ncbi:MAG: hypothetical protein IJQ12_04645 [Lachnospiraceae bacterium]|nr:hypothetical protein [Lachnospiraceae bacterium]
MTDKELRKLSRAELLGLLVEVTEENERLTAELAEIKEKGIMPGDRDGAAPEETEEVLRSASEAASGFLKEAQQIAQQIIADAQQSASRIRAQAGGHEAKPATAAGEIVSAPAEAEEVPAPAAEEVKAPAAEEVPAPAAEEVNAPEAVTEVPEEEQDELVALDALEDEVEEYEGEPAETEEQDEPVAPDAPGDEVEEYGGGPEETQELSAPEAAEEAPEAAPAETAAEEVPQAAPARAADDVDALLDELLGDDEIQEAEAAQAQMTQAPAYGTPQTEEAGARPMTAIEMLMQMQRRGGGQ